MPISGKVIEINENLESEPEIVNSDPYEKGWMIKVEIADTSALDAMLSADDYKSLISE